MDYRLRRLILIDSYSPGRVVEFPLEGGAVLTGRNGRGKTTLLQLVPIFYGENPTRIVGTETNRLDFNGYYLPRLTSYIIFEYVRRDVTCMVVLHASQQGGDRRYRFVRAAYRSDLFLLPDGVNILQVPDLRRHFKLKGVIHSEAISAVSEYRAIIQGKAGSGKALQRQRALVADYAFVGSGHHLTHIEKIVSGMFLRRTDFQDLQRMVVSCISDAEGEIALTTERRKIAAWPEHYGAYTRAMDQAGHMTQVLDREARLCAVEAELGRIHARVRRLLDHLDETDAANRQQRAHQAALAEAEEQDHRDAAEGMRIRLEKATRAAKDYETRAADLERQQEDWLRRDLPAKAELLAREPELRDLLGQLRQRQEALLGEHEAISLNYERLLNHLDRRRNAVDSEAAEARTELHSSFEPRFTALDAEARAETDRLRASHRGERNALEAQLGDTRERKGEYSTRLNNPQPDPELVEIHEAKGSVVETLDAERQAAEQRIRQCQQALDEAKAAHRAQEEHLQRLRKRREDLDQRRQTLLLQQSPGEDSLLHFLRTNRPDWVFDIAKVVREDLLVRTDLEPERIDTKPALYGVGLDLGHIEANLAADEAGLRREIADTEAQLKALDTERGDADRALTACNKTRRQADDTLSLTHAELRRIDTRLSSARDEAEDAQRRVEQSRKQAAERARTELAELKRAEQALRDEIGALDQRNQQAIEACDQRLAQDRKAIETERQAALEAHERVHSERKARQTAERAGIEAERDQALGAAGVDTAALKRLDQEIADTDRQLVRIDQSRNEVSQWRLWQQNDWPRREEHLRAAAEARELEHAARADLGAEEKRWHSRGAELREVLQRLDREHARLKDEIDAVRGRLDDFRPFPADEQVLAAPFDAGWTLEALTNQANSHQAEAKALAGEIGRLIEQVKRAFSAQRDTPPDQFYETHRAELGPEAPARAWILVFKTWFDQGHDEYRRLLAAEAKQIAGAIVGFHRDMDAFHRKVQQFNRELQQSLDENLGFESVSRVTVEVKSAIRELEYWDPIEAMAEDHRAWLRLEGHDLPPPEFAETLRKLLDHWEVREGIRAALPSLIRIQGEVVENGQVRTFRKAADLERVSSHGLSYLILCVIFIAFINRIRRQAPVEVVWALDELKDLDLGNIEALLTILRRNHITLVSAFPDPDAEVLALFRHRFSVEEGRRLLEARIVGTEETPLDSSLLDTEAGEPSASGSAVMTGDMTHA